MIRRRDGGPPNSDKISYQYDALGNRIVVNLNDQPVKKYIYSDKGQIIAEVNASGEMTQFIYVTQNHVPDYMIRGSALYRFVHDHLGSVRMVINASNGTISELVEYDEFGNVLSDTNPSFQPFRFAGCLYEASTKLCRFGARDYDPETGRWTSKDPILFSGGDTNLYGYVMADPINFIDSTGLSAADVGNITNQFNSYVNTSNQNGTRHPNGFWGNFMANTYWNTNGNFGHPYNNCKDQSEDLRNQLNNNKYDDPWNFDQITVGKGPFTHDFIRATSGNSKDPVLIIDPWWNSIRNGR